MNKKEYTKLNKEWLDAKSKETEVKKLKEGLYYKIINSSKNNNAKSPKPRSIVSVIYTGKTIDGNIFDTNANECPMAIRLNELIEAWIIALQEMKVGDKWEIYSDAKYAYGNMAQDGIPANSTLIFEIELINVF